MVTMSRILLGGCLLGDGVCNIIIGYKNAKSSENEGKMSGIKKKFSHDLGVWTYIFWGFLAVTVVYFIVDLVGCLYWFQNECRDLIVGALGMIYKGNEADGIECFERIVLCSVELLAAVELLFGFLGVECSIDNYFGKGMKLLKWAGQHVMNFIAAMGLYYTVYYSDCCGNEGNLLNAKNKALMNIAFFVVLELLTWDCFEFITKALKRVGEFLANEKTSKDEEKQVKIVMEVVKTQSGASGDSTEEGTISKFATGIQSGSLSVKRKRWHIVQRWNIKRTRNKRCK